MKNKLLKTFMIGATQLATVIAFSQNVTINYQTWNPPSPPCDVFNTATNVPATINGTNGTIEHVTLIGDAKMSNISLLQGPLRQSFQAMSPERDVAPKSSKQCLRKGPLHQRTTSPESPLSGIQVSVRP